MARIRSMIAAACLAVGTVSVTACSSLPDEIDRAEIDADSRQALNQLYAKNPAAKAIGQKARAVLVFPSIVKAGLGIGGAYGEGEMRQGGAVTGYYSTFTGSWGLQAGAQYTINTCGADLETECLTGVSPTSGSVISCSSDSYLLVYDMEGEPLVGW